MSKIIMQLKRLIKRFLIFNSTKANYKFILKDWIPLKDLKALSKVLETKRFSQNLDPVVISQPKARKALVISPHPDDDILSSGGTILKLIHRGCRVNVIYLASGSNGIEHDENNYVLTDYVSRVEEESRRVSNQLGTDIEFWRYPTRGIKIDDETINKVRKVYKELQPDIVFIPFIADDHDDHRRSVQLFYKSFKDFQNLDFEIWAYQVYSTVIPNVVVDITDFIDEKIRLINLWQTQRVKRDWSHYIRGLNAFNSRFLKTNQPRYAECFFVVPAKEYIDLCRIYFVHPDRDIYYCDSYK